MTVHQRSTRPPLRSAVLPRPSSPAVSPHTPAITLDPHPGPRFKLWADLARAHFARLSPAARAFRAALNLPTDRPVIMTGHQAEWWHPGILAKAVASHATAEALATSPTTLAASAWLIVDQDAHDDALLRLPLLDHAGHLHLFPWRIAGEPPSEHDNTPSARKPPWPRSAITIPTPQAPSSNPARWATRHLASTNLLQRIADSLARHADAPSRARQIALTLRDWACDPALATPVIPAAHAPHLLFASTLGNSPFFRNLITSMLADPRACVESHNRAAAAHPHAGITPLALPPETDKIELPLWHVPDQPAAQRSRVTVALARRALASAPAELMPRAVLATGLMRLAAADLFIHGTGGRLYDRVSHDWLTHWQPSLPLAPSVVASATLTLDIDFSPGSAPEPAESLDHLRWLLHHARHDPASLGDTDAAQRKSELIAGLRALRSRRRRDPAARARSRDLYRDLQSLLDSARARHTDDLARLAARVADATARRHESDLAADRTWFFGLYDPHQLSALAQAISSPAHHSAR